MRAAVLALLLGGAAAAMAVPATAAMATDYAAELARGIAQRHADALRIGRDGRQGLQEDSGMLNLHDLERARPRGQLHRRRRREGVEPARAPALPAEDERWCACAREGGCNSTAPQRAAAPAQGLASAAPARNPAGLFLGTPPAELSSGAPPTVSSPQQAGVLATPPAPS